MGAGISGSFIQPHLTDIQKSWTWSKLESTLIDNYQSDNSLPISMDKALLADISGLTEDQSAKLIDSISKNEQKSANAVSVIIMFVLLVNDSSPHSFAYLFDIMNFRCASGLNFQEIVSLSICAGSAMAAVLSVSSSFSQNAAIAVAKSLFESLKRSTKSGVISRDELVAFVSNKLQTTG